MISFSYEQKTEAETAQDNNNEEIERITVTGHGDAAMQAFNSGNFQLAEIKFKENARCALRAERSRAAGVDNMRNSSVNQNLSSDAIASVNTTSQNAVSSSSADVGSASSLTPNRKQRKNKQVKEHTCENRGLQLYMAGLSQLQLSRPQEARENFERAVVMNNNLYDAHYRLGLMKLLDNDKESAQDHLSSMQTLVKRCYNCDALSEILTRVDFLEKALDGRIKLK